MVMNPRRCALVPQNSVEPNVRRADDGAPFAAFLLDHDCKLVARAAAGSEPLLAQSLAHGGLRQHCIDVRVDLIEHAGGRSGRSKQSVPCDGFHAGIALLGERRHFLELGRALLAGGRQQLELAALQEREQRRLDRENRVGFAVTTETAASGEPLYGTCVPANPATILNSSMVRCEELPLPTEA